MQIEGVPIRGIVDTGSNITILSGPAFQEIVTMSKAPKKEHFKPSQQKSLHLWSPSIKPGRTDRSTHQVW